jgi:uncharacterized protein YfaS (alpha-2-macroglobulin family)
MGARRESEMKTSKRRPAIVPALLFPLLAAGLAAASPLLGATVPSSGGATVVPDRFLRRWDPVTIFFRKPTGPAKGGAEDAPERFVKLAPRHPGAWSWIDSSTLQFRPAEPWPALARVAVTVEGGTTTLPTLLSRPTSTEPSDHRQGLDPVDRIRLTFAEPVAAADLARVVSIELRPLPGIGSAGTNGQPPASRRLGRDDLEIKSLPRERSADPVSLVVVLRQPIPLGTRALVRLRLSLDDPSGEGFTEFSFETAEPFRVAAAGCQERTLPIASEGSRYSRDQAISCGGGRAFVVDFSATPAAIGPVEARNLLRFTPAVEKLVYEMEGRRLVARGDFAWDALYSATLTPAPLRDEGGRPLSLSRPSEVFFFFPRKAPFARLAAGSGLAERFGPKAVPVEARGQERIDLRIFPVDPLDRGFWPFPERPVLVDEGKRPPSPGEEPTPFGSAPRRITPREIGDRISALGSPPVSALLSIPLRRESGSASFGLDLAQQLGSIAGKEGSGSFLVGLRDLAGPSSRQWMRLDLSDLCLTTFEEPRAVVFVVTSLSSGLAVAGARVRVEGTLREGDRELWRTHFEGSTDGEGRLRWPAPGPDPKGLQLRTVERIVVESGGDRLLLDPRRPAEVYADNQWSLDREPWLGWTFEPLGERGTKPEILCHLFTERPVYRPEEKVYLKGYLRRREQGHLFAHRFDPAAVVVEGPGGALWRLPVVIGANGSFDTSFEQANLPTGVFSAWLENAARERFGGVSFRMEAYRIPQFEVELHAPDRAPLDEPFRVSLTASWYAGGRVAGRPVAWRVTQFPFDAAPGADRKRWAGYRFSSDGRFSRSGRFESSPRLEREDSTDSNGSASITLDPTIEPTAEPRAYVVEATVTGPDDQTVTATRKVVSLPPFALGLEAPRVVENAAVIEPQMIVLGPSGDPLAGVEVTARLFRREWHSHLRASDFSDGVARYVTDVVDEVVEERKVRSGAEPLRLRFPIPAAGVYLVELEARDRLDRALVVRVDLFAGGKGAVGWPRPETKVFSVTPDKKRYEPGETAELVLASPFQKGRALAVVEAPDGNRYSWLDVDGAKGIFRLPIDASWAPRVPVHFLLERGRIAGRSASGNAVDPGKPASMAATAWLEVAPTGNRVEVKLDHAESALPGGKLEVRISLSDPAGRPVAGEATLWLVDAAVLALGKEAPLDPLPDFLSAVRSHLRIHDTRDLPFGEIPFSESPGGDGGGEGEGDLLDRATVRKNFKSVPYWNPSIAIGPSGTATVTVDLPDNLTVFKVRAKAISGPERLGFAAGQVAVRLPLAVQPALPRFVRPGDRFVATAIGRIVEGGGGPGSAEIRIEGGKSEGPAKRELTWTPNRPERIETTVSVPTPPLGADGEPARSEILVRGAIGRNSDRATDAFEARLPIRDDRERVTKREILDLEAGKPAEVSPLPERARAGSIRRSVLLSAEPALVRMAAGLDLLLQYPYGCTEQRTSRARASLALRKFRKLLREKGEEARLDRAVREALDFIPDAVDRDGLVAYWPGAPGYVSLTAWTLQFLVEAKEAGQPVDPKLFDRLVSSLERALRSDFGRFVDGEALAERSWSLAALAQAGRLDPAYSAELARRSATLDPESTAEVLLALSRGAKAPKAAVDDLLGRLRGSLVFRLHEGREIWGGFQKAPRRNGLVLPSETRALAEVARGLARSAPKDPKLPLLVSALVTLGRGDGWGSTNADAAALLALCELLEPAPGRAAKRSVELSTGGKPSLVEIDADRPLARTTSSDAGAIRLAAKEGNGPLVARVESSWIPEADGSSAESESAGFVVAREQGLVRKEGEPLERHRIDRAGKALRLSTGDVVEERIEVVNPEARNYVAIVVPLAAGLEPLNPSLATSPPEARPTGRTTLAPTWVQYLDDRVAFYYDTLPAGTFEMVFRTRATIVGSFVQPPAKGEAMYDSSVRGNSPGARIEVVSREP